MQVNLTGRVIVKLFDSSQNLIYSSENHNIITDSGDAYIADLLATTPVRTKLTSSSCFIPVGTGWTGTLPKENDWVNTQVGISQSVDATFPKTKGLWNAANDNVLQFQVTYPQGSLNFTGINEAALTSHATDIEANSTVAYAQITPSVNVTTLDTLVIQWEITFT